LRLAINAADLGRQRGGNESYLLGLLEGLAEIAGEAGVHICPLVTADASRLVAADPRFAAFEIVNVGVYRRLPFFLWQQTAALRRVRPDWYASTFFLPPVIPCRAAVLIHDLSFRAHPGYFPRGIALYMRLLTGWALRRADLVVALSEFTRQEVLRFYPAAAVKTMVVYPGVGHEFAPAAGAATDRADEEILTMLGVRRPYLLAVGNIHPRKNLGRLLVAWQRLRDANHEVPAMVWAGLGRWESGELVDRAQAAGVYLPGFVAPQHLPALYRGAAALAYPSLYEGFGLPPLEAMACGTPVLTSNTTSLPEAVGDAAVTVDPGSVEALVGGLARVLFDEALRREMRARGLARAATFRWSETARRLLAGLNGGGA
jgi:glycosyltransferase involved in cell wall biosynthesis